MRALPLAPWMLALAAACRWGAPSEPGAARLALTPCRIDWHGSGHSDEVQCGTLDVLEDRGAGGRASGAATGKKIPLHVAVVRGLAGRTEPDPIFVLAGGPGQAATKFIPEVIALLAQAHRKRDLVFVDQRGTGGSNPLECPEPADAGIEARLRDTPDLRALRSCLSAFERDGSHPALYTTDATADDLDEVRLALGADKIDLWGASYGTRLGLAYLRRHGERVRSAVFDSVTPPTQSLLLSLSPDADRAFKLIFQACAADAACNAAFPALEARFRELLGKLEKQPAHVRLADPTTGAPVEVDISRSTFARGLHGLLYEPELSSILPLLVDRASRGDFQPFVTEVVSFDLAGDLSQGLFLSVICSEDARAATPDERARRNAGTFLGDGFAANLAEVCAFWPRGAPSPETAAPVSSEVPVLLLSGELDPVTPPAHAEEALAGLRRGIHVVVPGVGHGVTGRGCLPRLVARFIESAGSEPLDTSCVRQLDRPPFFLSFAGPTP